MDIGKFIDEYVALKDDNAKSRLVKKHIVTTYLDYVKKIDEAKKIVQHSCYDANGRYMINSPIRFMLFTMSVIRDYTDLEFSTENTVGQFDLLMKYRIMDSILPFIADDYAQFETILKMVFDDEYENNRSLPSFMEMKVASLMDVLAAMEVPDKLEDEISSETNDNTTQDT